MLYLEHLNLVVNDIPAAQTFYQAAFPHWRVRDQGESDWYGKRRKWLHLGDDYQYLTFNDNGEGNNRDLAGHQSGLAHFAFVTLAVVVEGLLDRRQADTHFLCRLDHRHAPQYVRFVAPLIAGVAQAVDQTLLFIEVQSADFYAAALRHLTHGQVGDCHNGPPEIGSFHTSENNA